MEHLIDIPGRLHSVAVEKHIAGTDQIYDDLLKTTQDILNLENITDVKVQEGKLQFLNIQGQVLKEISIASEQKQSDWNQTDSTQVDFIKNRPTVYNKQEVDDKLTTKQDTIDDLATIRSGAQAGATAYQKPQTGIPATDLASDTQSDLAAIDSIEAVIPEQASPSNQLADKNFVNSSVATNTANYISDNGQPFQSLEDLETYEGILTNNDYAFVVGADSVGNITYSRYKYNASTQQWALEYILNNSSFTAEQWESISSGITNSLVAKLSVLPTNSELTTILNGKVDTTDLNKYVPKTDDDGHGNQSIYSPGNITMTLADEQGSINQTGTFSAGGWSVSSPDGRFQTSANTIYRGTLGIDEDSVVWEKTAPQQIPTATTEDNGLMSAEDKKKLDDLAKVAISGSYNDLSDKPTIPTVPTNVSAFNNDAGYITEDDVDDVPTANSNNLVKSGGVYSTTPSITNTDAELSDLDFSDEDGNVLMRLSNGHIKTKNFDSSNLPSGNIIDTSSKAIYTVANTLTNGQTMTLNNPNLKNHYTLSFSATINTMGTITIEFGSENNWSKGRIEITPTNIVYYKYSTWEPITIQHNIDIRENISVIIKTTKVHFAEIYLLSNDSGVFHQEISWNGSGNGCSLSNANGSYSNCTFSLNCQGLLKDVWIFGDSYTDKWPLCLDELGFDNYLLDGFSGRTSQQAYESFLKDIAIAKPKAIIWMMGMNDPDNGSVNSSWKTAFDNVKTLCDINKIEFIYTTIPCVPQLDNSYKNNYATNSGVRIIPIASILGASSQGSSWYAGLLSSDNVHPSNSGSMLIALTLLNNITLLQEK